MSLVCLKSNVVFRESLPIFTLDPVTGKAVSIGKKSIGLNVDEIKRCPLEMAEHLMREYNVPAGTRPKGRNTWFEIVEPENPSQYPLMDYVELVKAQPTAHKAQSNSTDVDALNDRIYALMATVEGLTKQVNEMSKGTSEKEPENKQSGTEDEDKKPDAPTPNRQMSTKPKK